MLRLIKPGDAHPIKLPFDDGPQPTIFWTRPMTEREYAEFRLQGKPTGTDAEQDAKGWPMIAKIIAKVENVNWGGQLCASYDDQPTIIEILRALPAKTAVALVNELAEFSTLTGRYSKNSDGSSALIDTGSPVVRQTGTNAASEKDKSSSGSQEFGTAQSESSQTKES